MVYTNRLCELMNDGRHLAPAAVRYHGKGDWTGKYMRADKAGHRLADAQIDYDVIPADVFADREYYHTRIGKGTFTVNTQQYRALILPEMQFNRRWILSESGMPGKGLFMPMMPGITRFRA